MLYKHSGVCSHQTARQKSKILLNRGVGREGLENSLVPLVLYAAKLFAKDKKTVED